MQQNPTKISGYTKRIIEHFDFEKFRSVRQQNSLKIFKDIRLHGGNLLFENYRDYCTTGIPVIVRNRSLVISRFKKANIEVLTYTKYWNFIPDKDRYKFKDEIEFQKSHLLIPASENFSAEQIKHIIAASEKILQPEEFVLI